MAIQVGGTTVIDNSRNLQNVQGIKTVGGNSILGSGDISVGASTSSGAVGTYVWGRPENTTDYGIGNTASGVKVPDFSAGPGGANVPNYKAGMGGWAAFASTISSTSGTWRCLTRAHSPGSGYYDYQGIGLWVRIS